MLNKLRYLSLMCLTVFMVGCGYEQVPPAHVGKILDTNGYQADIVPPSRVYVGWREELVLVQTGTETKAERMEVIMQDKLTLGFDERFRTRIKTSDERVLNGIFNDIAVDRAGGQRLLTLSTVYNTYGKMLVRNKAREVISQYSVEDVHKNYARISSEIYKAITDAAQGIPLTVSDVALGNIAYPKLITAAVEAAVEAAEERRVAIATQEAQVQIEMKEKEGQQKLAEMDYKIEMTKARALRDVNKTVAEGITPELIALKTLEVQQALAKNNSAVFVPYESLNNTGLNNRMFSK